MVVIRPFFFFSLFNAISYNKFPIFIKLLVILNAKLPIKNVFF